MKDILRFSSLLLLALAIGPSAQTAPNPKLDHKPLVRYVVKQEMHEVADGQRLSQWLARNRFDVAGMNWKHGEVEVITTLEGVKFLEAKGLKGRVKASHLPGEAFEKLDARYLNPDKVTAKLKAMHEAFPKVTRLEQIGTSIQGRPIWAMLISSNPEREDPKALEKPSIIFDAMHHAREVMTAEIVMDVGESFLKMLQAQNHRAEQIVQDWNVWIVPMLNVDGNAIVWSHDNWWRKNAHADGGSVYGVDINRNYAFQWNGCKGSSSDKGNDAYRGEAAGSEPETQALMKLGTLVQPAASLSYHSYSELVLYPYGCTDSLSGENELIAKIAHELAAKLPSDSGEGTYTPGAPWQILYAVDGDSMSFMHAAFGALAYTFEVNLEFQPKYETVAPTLAKERVAWRYFLSRIDGNLLAVKVIDDKSGKAAPALIAINTIRHTHGEKPFHTNKAGNYFKVLDPGKYVVAAKLEDGRTGELEVQMAGKQQHVELHIH